MNFLSNIMMPLLVFIILVHAIIKKVDIYNVFIKGAKESFDMIFKLFPCLLAMILAVNIFVRSDIVITLFSFISFIPNEILPMIITRPISGTASLAILTNIYQSIGPDSYLGVLASFIQGSTDTTFYVITLYFGSIGIKKIKYALWAGLLADVAAIIMSFAIINLFF